MKVTVLGGGSEIGASCLHIQFDQTSVLIDAGMRMRGENVLPMLGMLEELDKPAAILVTHAHADHIGALPVVHAMYPDVPVFQTPPTADLMQIMMKDSYKILSEQSRLNQTLMPFTEEQMTALLQNLRTFPANGELQLDDVKITAYRAGHIIGAVMFLLEAEGERILVTGDLSFSGGRTIPGARVADQLNPDVMVMESTYGNRLHTDRNTEEKRLAEAVAETIQNGGFALIPAFALGRGQEVLLVLQDYMEKGLIPEFPIYVDGLVTPVCGIYRHYPHYLKGPVAHRVRTKGDAFLTEGRCVAVQPQDRKTIVSGKPACIVASSGMLTGGASAWYAQELIDDAKNAIYLTGYQDEESPGKKLLALADGMETTLDIDGKTYDVKASVDKFGLSAHADANEMNRFVEAMNPTYTLLVHGDDDARHSLVEKINPRFHPMLSENGESYPFTKRKEGRGVIGKRYNRSPEQERLRQWIGHVLLYQKEDDKPLKFGLCQKVHPKFSLLHCDTPKGKLDKVDASRVADSLGNWSMSIDAFNEMAIDVLTFSRPYLETINWDLVPEQTLSFAEIVKRLQIENNARQQFAVALALQSTPETSRHYDIEGRVGYRLDRELRFQLSNLDLPIQAIKMNPNQAQDHVRSYFAEHPRFLRCGVQEKDQESAHILLSFDFPTSLSVHERKRIKQDLQAQTGWAIHISDSVRHEAFQPLLAELLAQPVEMPSVHIRENTVVTKADKPTNSARIKDQFNKRTGFTLKFSGDSNLNVSDIPEESSLPSDNTEPDAEPMEINQAIATVKAYGKKYNVTLYKAGVKTVNEHMHMVVHFISPEVAMRYRNMLQALRDEIGMAVQYATQPKQNEILRIIKESIPSTWEMKGNPSIHMENATVSVKVNEQPTDAELEQISQAIEQKTGYQLTLK